jgi:hypothetical protein
MTTYVQTHRYRPSDACQYWPKHVKANFYIKLVILSGIYNVVN